MNRKPMIVPFETKKSKYIFDGVTAEIIPSSDMIETIINEYTTLSKEELFHKFELTEKDEFEHTYQYIAGLIQAGMFYFQEQKDVQETGPVPMREKVLNGSGSQLILVLTEKCNMRCEYCVYSDKYPHEIGYSDKEMDFAMAKKAVDLFFELHEKRFAHGYLKPPFVCFYGGEPLLKMDLIKQVVAYVESIRDDVVFYITTNGLLLKGETAEFIAKHNFNVTFSLDGFKENHDRNRVTVGGKKTFDVIYQNLVAFQNMKKRNNSSRLISFNCCYDNYTNIYDCVKFFEQNYDLFFPFYCVYAPVKPYDTSYYEWVKEYMAEHEYAAAEDEFRTSLKKVRDEFFSSKEGNERFREIATALFVGHYSFSVRNKWVFSEFNNSCMPLDKLAVYPDGQFALCEKMNARLPIGDVDTGLDFEKIEEMANKFKENFTKKECSTCPIRTSCNACFMYLNEEGQIDWEFCAEQKNSFRKRLEEMYSLREQGIDFMQIIDMNKNRMELLETMK